MKARLRMCNKMQSIWDYMRTYVYMCLEVCTHVVLVVCESVYAFRFLYPLCACVCVCLCARAHTPVGLLIFTEGARMNSSSDGGVRLLHELISTPGSWPDGWYT